MVARQPHRFGEVLVDVDRVEVPRGARVAVRQVLVRCHLQLRDRVPGVQVGHSRSSDDVGPGAAGRPGRRPAVHRGGLEDVEPRCRVSRRGRDAFRGGGDLVARAGGLDTPLEALVPHAPSSAKFIPTSGSNIAGASGPHAVDDGEHRRRDDVAEAGLAGRRRRRSGPGSRSPAAVAYLLTLAGLPGTSSTATTYRPHRS